MSNLPDFPGAAAVYERAEKICSYLNAKKYRETHDPKKKRNKFEPDETALEIVAAMNAGDEEVLKDFTYRYRDIWLEKTS